MLMEAIIKTHCLNFNRPMLELKNATLDYLKSTGIAYPELSGEVTFKTYMGEKQMRYQFLFKEISELRTAVLIKLNITSYSGFDYMTYFSSYRTYVEKLLHTVSNYSNYSERDFATAKQLENSREIPYEDNFIDAIQKLKKAYQQLQDNLISEEEYKKIYQLEIGRL